ncbi:MAG: DNA-protecting protein DprA, partial [Muribaculaceae bacterium]|nr:DNA-protecting protein DprA [Muribaculaceae bacterium]
ALLYATGTPLPPATRPVAIVGTRHCTPYGVQFTDRLVHGIAERYGRVAIVSGLAYGIDAAAHRAALREGLPTVAVMANPLNTVYPADHRDLAAQIVARGGILLSEYPTSAHMHRGFFLARNRIVAGIADATIVVESDIRGGAMSTARLAAAYNRELFAAPGRATDATSRGCLELLARSEALLVRDADDIAAALGWTPAAEGTQRELLLELTPEQQRIVDHIRLHPADTVNDIAAALSTPYPALTAILFELEMSDVVATLPGGRYAVLDR